jgi:hypothetical protein
MLGLGALVLFGSGLLPLGILVTLGPAGVWTTPDNPTALGLALIVIVLLGIGWLGLSVAFRGLLHRRALRGHPSLPPEAFAEARDPSLPWHPNHAASPKRLQVLVSVIAAAAVLDLVLVIAITSANSVVEVRIFEIILVFAAVVGATAGFLAALPFPVPSAVALGDDGIHFWYDTPFDRRTARDVLPWVDLNLLAMRTPGNVDAAMRLVRYLRIDPDNARALSAEWPKHRIDRTGPPPPKPSSATREAPAAAPVAPTSAPPIGAQVSASQRGAVCARCHVRFPGLEGLRLLWCKVDGFFVCRRCWREGCHEGHGRGSRAVWKTWHLVAAVVITIALLAVWYPAPSYDYALTNEWHSGTVVPIPSLQPGELVKVQGTIVSSSLIAWGGHEMYSSNAGWWWDWNSTDVFRLVEVGGPTIEVTTQAFYIGYNGPHIAPYATHTEMWVYESGDQVQVVGTVVRTGSGALALEAQIVSQLGAVPLISLAPSFEDVVLLPAIPLGIASLGIGTEAILVSRRRRTRKALGGQPLLELDGTEAVRDSDLDWQPNGRGTNPQRRERAALTSLLVGAGLLVAYSFFLPRPGSGYWNLGFFGTVVIIIEGPLVGMLLFGGIGRPTYVAVAADGFRLWYDSPYDRHLNDAAFPWGEIQDIHMTGGKGAHWVLRWTDGEYTNLYMLNGHNLSLLIREWTTRRMPVS